MTPLFTETIAGWESWSRVYQSIPAFTPLARHIIQKHGLPKAPLRHLTPGTNAVFAAGDYVLKIYAPREAGVEAEPALAAEAAGLCHAETVGVPAPRIIARGEVRDRYCFLYLVIPYIQDIQGREAGDALPTLPATQKAAFAGALRALLGGLNTPPAPGVAAALPADLAAQAAENHRWKPFPAGLRRGIVAAAKALPAEGRVFTHGDLTGENVLLDAENRPTLLDFGDCHLAPAWYEWPPLCFELLRLDAGLMDAFFTPAGWRCPAFARRLALATALHDFGGDFALMLCRATGTAPAAVTGLAALRALVARRLAAIPQATGVTSVSDD